MLLLQVSETRQDCCIQKIQKTVKNAHTTRTLRTSTTKVNWAYFSLGFGRRRKSLLWIPSRMRVVRKSITKVELLRCVFRHTSLFYLLQHIISPEPFLSRWCQTPKQIQETRNTDCCKYYICSHYLSSFFLSFLLSFLFVNIKPTINMMMAKAVPIPYIVHLLSPKSLKNDVITTPVSTYLETWIK